MGRSALQYKNALWGLMPRGRAITRALESFFDQVLYGMAEEFARIDERAYDLINENVPSNANELITEYEEEFGIWDAADNLTDRQEAVHAKNILIGRQDKQYFIDIATALGYDTFIEEFVPFWADIALAGDPCNPQKNLFYWLMYVNPDGDKGAFSVGFSHYGFDAIPINYKDYVMYSLVRAFWDLIDEIWRIRPGHTIALFDFYYRGFSRGFGWGFHAIPTDDSTCPLPGFSGAFSDGFNNLREYDGEYLIGGFNHAFNLGFDTHFGGGFEYDAFTDGFWRPA